MTNKHYLGTFQINTSKKYRRKMFSISRTLSTEGTMVVVEYYGGGDEEIQAAVDLVNDLILHGWRDAFEAHNTK